MSGVGNAVAGQTGSLTKPIVIGTGTLTYTLAVTPTSDGTFYAVKNAASFGVTGTITTYDYTVFTR
jgi:hypothetical protein